MSAEDMAYGISQLQALDDCHEGTITSCDSEIYWSSTVKLDKCSKENLNKTQIVGRGGTNICPFFEEYEERLGKQDFIIMITDGYLSGHEMETMQDPLIPTYWLITSDCVFEPSFGKVFHLRNM